MGDKQVIFTGSNGKVRIEEREMGELLPGHVRVKVSHSGISPGTELLGLDRSVGSDQEFRMGYQAAGIVEAVGAGMEQDYTVGDAVACFGAPYVYHASHLNVPRHCVTPLPPTVGSRHAAFCNLNAIALHGFRHTGCSVGETVAVVGLGLLGNLAAQCASAAGCRVVSSELLPRRVQAAADAGLEVVASLDDLKERVQQLSSGHGADAVMLAVKNTDDALLAHAYQMVRRLGRIVILGLSDAQLPRELMFSKEATIVVSRAAGWGRYNRLYEFEGQDFPYEHARWTEHRNLEEAMRLVSIGGVQMEPLITDVLSYTDVVQGYDLVRNNPADHLAVAFRWH
jgi:threonine dehydrogenase-like Zn-dependent dehydrogenase